MDGLPLLPDNRSALYCIDIAELRAPSSRCLHLSAGFQAVLGPAAVGAACQLGATHAHVRPGAARLWRAPTPSCFRPCRVLAGVHPREGILYLNPFQALESVCMSGELK